MTTSASLPDFKKFDIHTEPTSLGIRWKAWVSEFGNLLIALGITDKKRQRALMLYYGGEELYQIYKSLVPADFEEEFEAAKARLTTYFEPKVNKTYEIYYFRQMQQGKSDGRDDVSYEELIDPFVTRLRKKAARCGFTDTDTEIKYQLIFGCRSPKLRRYALQKDELSLDELIEKGRSYEVSQQQASEIEGTETSKECNQVRGKPGKYSKRYDSSKQNYKSASMDKLCFNCGDRWPHVGGNRNCPAKGVKCKRWGELVYFFLFNKY